MSMQSTLERLSDLRHLSNACPFDTQPDVSENPSFRDENPLRPAEENLIPVENASLNFNSRFLDRYLIILHILAREDPGDVGINDSASFRGAINYALGKGVITGQLDGAPA